MNKTYIKSKAKITKQSGFTLLEVLVAFALGVAILTSAIVMQLQHRKGFALTTNKLEMQTNAKFAFEFISQSLRSAGSMGCKNAEILAKGVDTLDSQGCASDVCINLTDPTSAFADFRPGREVLGYQSLGSSLSPVLSNVFTFVTPGYNNDNSDVLTVSGGFGEVYNLDDVDLVETDSGFQLDLTDVSQVHLINNQYGMLTSCLGAKIFQVVSTNAQIGTGLINWAGQLGSRSAMTVSSGDRREFRRAAVVTYYVGQFPLGDANGVPTLYQDVDGVSTRLIEGVEELQLLYGYYDNASSDRNVANRYDTADNIPDWSKVISVRVGLIMRSATPVFETDQTQNMSLACAGNYTQNTKTDRFARTTYCAEVTLRNRLIGSRS